MFQDDDVLITSDPSSGYIATECNAPHFAIFANIFQTFAKKSVHLTVSPGPKPGAGLWSSAYPSLHLILATTTRLEEWHVLRMGTSALCSKYLPAHKSILP